MQSPFNRILTIVMAGVVFFASSGFGLVEHSCKMRGSREITTSQEAKKGCCPSHNKNLPAQTTIACADCCESDSAFLSVDLAPVVEKASHILVNIGQAILHAFINVFNHLLPNQELATHSSDSSPPLAGRALLNAIHNHRI